MIRIVLGLWLISACIVLGLSWLLGSNVIEFTWRSVTGLWLIMLGIALLIPVISGIRDGIEESRRRREREL